MKRYEVVADALEKIDYTIVIEPDAKHWTVQKQADEIKKTEKLLKRVGDMIDSIRTLVYNGYPIEVTTYVQPKSAGEMSLRSSDDENSPLLSIDLSPHLLGEVATMHHLTFGEIEQVARKDVLIIIGMIFDYLDNRWASERKWEEYLNTEVEPNVQRHTVVFKALGIFPMSLWILEATRNWDALRQEHAIKETRELINQLDKMVESASVLITDNNYPVAISKISLGPSISADRKRTRDPLLTFTFSEGLLAVLEEYKILDPEIKQDDDVEILDVLEAAQLYLGKRLVDEVSHLDYIMEKV